ncbi:MAG: DNA repair exonuclease SbcCD ATPase subunit [Crocinitomicaceae bacterium]|jgi:DNA repair exonuclease SbcCD ATPase subunit
MKNHGMFIPVTGKWLSFVKNRALSALTLIAVISLTSFAHAQKLDEFEDCADKSGVESIPYSSLRSDAARNESSKKEAEKLAKSEFGPDVLKLKKSQTANKIKKEKEVLKKAKSDLEEQKRYLPNDIDDHKEKVEESEERLEALEKTMEGIEEDIEYGVDVWNQVYIARGKVRESFDKVIDQLGRSLGRPSDHIGSKPSSSDEDATEKWEDDLENLKKYIAEIKVDIVREKSGHKKAEDQAKAIRDKLKYL